MLDSLFQWGSNITETPFKLAVIHDKRLGKLVVVLTDPAHRWHEECPYQVKQPFR
jgi:hypothetical protein